jgi:LemA protein
VSTGELVAAALAAVLLFWIIGAYNRLVQLRGAIVRAFAPVDEQIRRRHGLLQQLLEVLTPLLPNATPRLEALRAAGQQVESACSHARVRPGAAGAITSLRLADEILVEARARLPAQGAAGVDLSGLNAQLVEIDTALAFARRQFNAAVDEYNAAVTQFPTVLIVGLFGFHSAVTL